MRMHRIGSKVEIALTGLLTVLVWTAVAAAAPQQLDCTLTDTADQLGSEKRPIVIVFDEAAITLKAQDGSQSYTFGNVSISNIAISGGVNNVSLGIDRSSLGVVWQQYQADKTIIEFGTCQRSTPPGAAGAQ